MKTGDSDNYIQIKVIPNASTNIIEGWEADRLKVRIRAVPEKGKANKKLIEFLADELGISKTSITIESGESSRIKRIRIEGISKEDLQKKWPSKYTPHRQKL